MGDIVELLTLLDDWVERTARKLQRCLDDDNFQRVQPHDFAVRLDDLNSA